MAKARHLALRQRAPFVLLAFATAALSASACGVKPEAETPPRTAPTVGATKPPPDAGAAKADLRTVPERPAVDPAPSAERIAPEPPAALAPVAEPTPSAPSPPTRTSLAGCWSPIDEGEGARLLLDPPGQFRWGTEQGRYLLGDGSVWLLGPDRVGTKWKYRLDGDELTLHFPESFQYLGGSRYLYFRFQSTKTAHRFRWGPVSPCP